MLKQLMPRIKPNARQKNVVDTFIQIIPTQAPTAHVRAACRVFDGRVRDAFDNVCTTHAELIAVIGQYPTMRLLMRRSWVLAQRTSQTPAGIVDMLSAASVIRRIAESPYSVYALSLAAPDFARKACTSSPDATTIVSRDVRPVQASTDVVRPAQDGQAALDADALAVPAMPSAPTSNAKLLAHDERCCAPLGPVRSQMLRALKKTPDVTPMHTLHRFLPRAADALLYPPRSGANICLSHDAQSLLLAAVEADAASLTLSIAEAEAELAAQTAHQHVLDGQLAQDLARLSTL